MVRFCFRETESSFNQNNLKSKNNMDLKTQLENQIKAAQDAFNKAVAERCDYKGTNAAEKNRLNLKITATEAFLKRQEIKFANLENSLATA